MALFLRSSTSSGCTLDPSFLDLSGVHRKDLSALVASGQNTPQSFRIYCLARFDSTYATPLTVQLRRNRPNIRSTIVRY
ncbi:hypothetical protein OUZ56_019234 [Daphnia magna]|uniref:Uncharacterized protein n=1 Tax=Daphnia magna TaxID=35525 RepID=A0ABQ9ZBN5_9CRUS|nr:hypothetical protein OUZ56_019234 [Daphnia magna]